MQDLSDFITEHEITAEVDWAAENPNMRSEQPMNHYVVTLKTPLGELRVPFSQGLGLTDEPTAADVLDCLASDASMATEYRDGVELAVALGETIESQADVDRARDTFNTITEQTEGLRRILGDDATDDLVYEIERA